MVDLRRSYPSILIAQMFLTLVIASAPAAGRNVLTYHNTASRQGSYVDGGLTKSFASQVHLDKTFNGVVSGAVYAQPLFWTPPSGPAEVIVATENDIVYALDASTGQQIWATTLGTPVPLADLPCGNIDPRGITGTPVIDPASATLYVEAMVESAAGPRHQVFGLSLANGQVQAGWPVDVSAGAAALQIPFNNGPQGQRSALTLAEGNLFVPYAGLDGDCGVYSGMLVGVDTQSPGVFGVWSTKIAGGGSWGASGAAFDGAALYLTTGNSFSRYVAAGNGNVTPAQGWGGEEAVIRLRPTLADPSSTNDYFAPADWSYLDATDLDLGGTSAIPLNVPVPLSAPAPRVLALGKDGNAYLLNRQNLGGIGGQVAMAHVSSGQIVSAMAVFPTSDASMVAVRAKGAACSGNLMVLSVTPNAISTAWCASFSGDGSPIVTTSDGVNDPIVWVVGSGGSNALYGFDGLTGAAVVAASGGPNPIAPRQTPILANGRIYVAANGAVYAFSF